MKKKQQLISDMEVQQALQKFKEQGGLIKKLPDEVVPSHNMVGGRWAVYEAIQESGADLG